MKFLFLICADEKVEARMSEAEMGKIVDGHRRFAADLRAAGKMLGGERLRPEAEAARVRIKAGKPQVTDGPFAETKEALGGFYLVDCASREEALALAARIPLRDSSFIEVRPVWEM